MNEIRKILDRHERIYLFDEKKFINNFNLFKKSFLKNFDNIFLGYSFKTNYIPYLCLVARKLGCYAEVVSNQEYDLAKKLGFGNKILVNGPCKNTNFLKEIINKNCYLNIDSMEEFYLLSDLLKIKKKNFNFSIRCNLRINKKNSRFGINLIKENIEQINYHLSKNKYLKLDGVHCHLPFRDPDSFKQRSIKISKLLKKLNFSTKKIKINIGGGFNSLMTKNFCKKNNLQNSTTFKKYSSIISKNLNLKKNRTIDDIELWAEPGTALVSNTLDYYFKVVSLKKNNSYFFVNTSGSIYDVKPNSKNIKLEIEKLQKSKKNKIKKKYLICGYTCIENDFISRNYSGNLKEGDVLRLKDVGSYSFSMKPNFIKPKPAVYLKKGKKLKLLHREEKLIS